MSKFLFISFFLFSSFFAEAQTGTTVKVYPNPATVLINFEFTTPIPEGSVLSIYNVVGKKIREIRNINYKTVLPIQDFARGVYIFMINSSTTNAVVANGKFQVSR